MPARARSRRTSLQLPHETLLHRALIELKTDLPIAEFLRTHFADRHYTELREAVRRRVEGYDAADPNRASTFALRDEWLGHGRGRQGRIGGGYGALINFLVSECRKQGTTIHLLSVVTAINESHGRLVARCQDGTIYEADAAIVTVPLPILRDISLPNAVHEKVAASADIGFGNVVKILLCFTRKWWTHCGDRDLSELSFLILRRNGSRLVNAASVRFSSADRLVRWTKSRRRRATYRQRACRYGPRVTRGDFRSASGPHHEASYHLASNQLGQRPFRTRRLFLCHSQNTASAAGAPKNHWRRRILFWRSTVHRPGYGHRRGGAGKRKGNSADDSGRRTIERVPAASG